jgi:hypothetical protein
MMASLIGLQPTSIHEADGVGLFYFGKRTPNIYLLPANSIFEVVYGPLLRGWQFARYQLFGANNGAALLERRGLTADEIDYFESLLKIAKVSHRVHQSSSFAEAFNHPNG